MMSKMRTNIKTKFKPEDLGQVPETEIPGTSAIAMKAEAIKRKAANKNPSISGIVKLPQRKKVDHG
jgi:hypothetical protein